MYNLLEDYSMTSGSLDNYYRKEVNDSANLIYDNDNTINKEKTTRRKFSEYKIKMIVDYQTIIVD